MLDRSVSGRHVEIYLAVAGPCSNVPGEDLNSEPAQSSFSRWKDIMIPGHIDEWRAVELRKQNRLAEARDVLLSFHGRHAGNAESYENVTVRSAIMALDGLPGVSAPAAKLWPSVGLGVGGFVEGYHELIGRSRFCLAPRGITPWTIHLYVAMLAGCIPAARCWQDLARDLKISGCKLSFLLKLARVNRFHSLSLVGLNFGGSQASRSYKVEVILSDDFESSVPRAAGLAQLFDQVAHGTHGRALRLLDLAAPAAGGRDEERALGIPRSSERLRQWTPTPAGSTITPRCPAAVRLQRSAGSCGRGCPTSLCGKLLATQGRRERACRHRWTMFLWRVYGLGF